MLSYRQKEALLGFSAGTLSTIVNHPLDVVKIRLQLDAKLPSQLEAFNSVLQSLRGGKRTATIRNIYRGLPINLIGNAASWGLYFTIYNDLKKTIDLGSNYQTYLGCSLLTGLLVAFITNPIWVLKTRLLSTNKNFPNAYKSTWDGIVSIYKNEGPTAFFRGFTPSLVLVCQGALYFTLYDSLKHHRRLQTELSFWDYLAMTLSAKIVSTCVFYPFQLFKSRLQSYNFQLESIGLAKMGFREVVKKTYKNEGVAGFYKGLYVNLARTLPAACVTFMTYEYVKKAL